PRPPADSRGRDDRARGRRSAGMSRPCSLRGMRWMRDRPPPNDRAGGPAGLRRAGTSPLMPRDAPEDPPGFVVRPEAQREAWDHGFRLGEIWRTASTPLMPRDGP